MYESFKHPAAPSHGEKMEQKETTPSLKVPRARLDGALYCTGPMEAVPAHGKVVEAEEV